MKIGGIDPGTLPAEEVLVLPRGEESIVFRARGLADMDEFDKLCPEPKPPVRLTKAGREPNEEDANWRSAMLAHGRRRVAYMVVKSLEPSEIEYAAGMLARATTTEETSDALAQFDRAAAFAKQAEAIADRTKNRQLEAKAAEAVRGVLQQQLVAEEQLRQSQQRRAQDAASAAAREKRNLDRLKVLSVRLQESASLFEDDKELPAAERAKRLKGYQEAFREFRRIALTSETLDVGPDHQSDEPQSQPVTTTRLDTDQDPAGRTGSARRLERPDRAIDP